MAPPGVIEGFMKALNASAATTSAPTVTKRAMPHGAQYNGTVSLNMTGLVPPTSTVPLIRFPLPTQAIILDGGSINDRRRRSVPVPTPSAAAIRSETADPTQLSFWDDKNNQFIHADKRQPHIVVKRSYPPSINPPWHQRGGDPGRETGGSPSDWKTLYSDQNQHPRELSQNQPPSNQDWFRDRGWNQGREVPDYVYRPQSQSQPQPQPGPPPQHVPPPQGHAPPSPPPGEYHQPPPSSPNGPPRGGSQGLSPEEVSPDVRESLEDFVLIAPKDKSKGSPYIMPVDEYQQKSGDMRPPPGSAGPPCPHGSPSPPYHPGPQGAPCPHGPPHPDGPSCSQGPPCPHDPPGPEHAPGSVHQHVPQSAPEPPPQPVPQVQPPGQASPYEPGPLPRESPFYPRRAVNYAFKKDPDQDAPAYGPRPGEDTSPDDRPVYGGRPAPGTGPDDHAAFRTEPLTLEPADIPIHEYAPRRQVSQSSSRPEEYHTTGYAPEEESSSHPPLKTHPNEQLPQGSSYSQSPHAPHDGPHDHQVPHYPPSVPEAPHYHPSVPEAPHGHPSVPQSPHGQPSVPDKPHAPDHQPHGPAHEPLGPIHAPTPPTRKPSVPKPPSLKPPPVPKRPFNKGKNNPDSLDDYLWHDMPKYHWPQKLPKIYDKSDTLPHLHDKEPHPAPTPDHKPRPRPDHRPPTEHHEPEPKPASRPPKKAPAPRPRPAPRPKPDPYQPEPYQPEPYHPRFRPHFQPEWDAKKRPGASKFYPWRPEGARALKYHDPLGHGHQYYRPTQFLPDDRFSRHGGPKHDGFKKNLDEDVFGNDDFKGDFSDAFDGEFFDPDVNAKTLTEKHFGKDGEQKQGDGHKKTYKKKSHGDDDNADDDDEDDDEDYDFDEDEKDYD